MKKCLNILFVVSLGLLHAANVSGQAEHYLFRYMADSVKFGGNAIGHINSSALNTTLMENYNSEGFLTTEIKDELIAQHDVTNKVGGALDIAVHLQVPFEKGALFFAIADREYLQFNYSKDLMSLILYGNRKFAGTTLTGGPESLDFVRYQQLQAGWKFKWNAEHQSFIALSGLKGEQLWRMRMNEFELTTETNGSYVDFAYDLEVQLSDTANSTFGALNGLGFSLDIGHQIQFGGEQHPGTIALELQDLGQISWNDQTMQYLLPYSEKRFDGVEIDNILSFNDTTLNIDQDSLIEELIGTPTFGKYNGVLPARVHLRYQQAFGRHHVGATIMHQFSDGFTPYFQSRYHYLAADKFILGTRIGWGGYGNLGFGLNLGFESDRFGCLIGLNNLERLLSSGTSMDTSGLISWYVQL